MIYLIIGYLVSVYYTRRLNKLLVKRDEFNPIWPLLWFMPVIGPLMFTLIYIMEIFNEKNRSRLPNWLSSFVGHKW